MLRPFKILCQLYWNKPVTLPSCRTVDATAPIQLYSYTHQASSLQPSPLFTSSLLPTLLPSTRSMLLAFIEVRTCGLPFCARLHIKSSHFIHVIENDGIFFLQLNSIPLHTHISFTHMSVGHLGWFTISDHVDAYLSCDILLSFPFDTNPVVGLLDHLVVLFLVFWGSTIPFSTVEVLICIRSNSRSEFLFLHILSLSCFFL